jgi:hypothetical protein
MFNKTPLLTISASALLHLAIRGKACPWVIYPIPTQNQDCNSPTSKKKLQSGQAKAG